MMWFSSLPVLVAAAFVAGTSSTLAHGDHHQHKPSIKRDMIVERATPEGISLPTSLNLTNSSLSYLAQAIQNHDISYLAPYVNFTRTPAGEATALEYYNQLISLFGIVPNVTNSIGGFNYLFAGLSCDTCQSALSIFQEASKGADPTNFNIMAEAYCLAISTQSEFGACLGYLYTLTPFFAQIIQLMDVKGPDGQVFCFTWGAKCPNYIPPIPEGFIPAKPDNLTMKPRSGQTANVLHLSDYHIDLRYSVGSEAQCTQYDCCHDYGVFGDLGPVKFPAPQYGAYLCDTPHGLGTSTFKSIASSVSNLSYAIYTGDLVSHDLWDLNASYILKEELTSYNDFYTGLGPDVPVYPVLGNHDTFPHGLNPGPCLSEASPALEGFMAENYKQVSSAWAKYNWITSEEASYAASHYGSYVVDNVLGQHKIIALQTDAWYYFNYFNYINVSNADPLGQMALLVEELSKSEAMGQKVWIIGHVASGDEDSPQGLGPATDLFYQIVARYSPHTISGLFFGHEHTDNFALYYSHNATSKSYDTAVASSWIVQSVTPFTYLNAGWRYYEVDTGSFEIMDSHNFYANISNSNTSAWNNGPVWEYEYSARATYAPAGYSPELPLDAAFWHNVSERFITNSTLRGIYNDLSVKLAPTQLSSINPSPANASLQVCTIQSGSQPIWHACFD